MTHYDPLQVNTTLHDPLQVNYDPYRPVMIPIKTYYGSFNIKHPLEANMINTNPWMLNYSLL